MIDPLRRLRAATTVFVLCASGLFAGGPALAASSGPDEATFGPEWSPEDCGVFKLPENDASVLCGYVSVPLRHGVAAAWSGLPRSAPVVCTDEQDVRL